LRVEGGFRVTGLGFGVYCLWFKVLGLSRILGKALRIKVQALSAQGSRWEGSTTVGNCRLAKFRDLMYGGRYSAVIGLKVPKTWKVTLGTLKKVFFDQSQLCISPNTSNHGIRQTIVKSCWLGVRALM